MGTFRLQALAVGSKTGGWIAQQLFTTGTTDADLVAGANGTFGTGPLGGDNILLGGPPAPFNDPQVAIRFTIDDQAIILDEGTVDEQIVTIDNLPDGFHLVSAVLTAAFVNLLDDTSTLKLQFSPSDESSAQQNFLSNGRVMTYNRSFSPAPTIEEMITDGFGAVFNLDTFTSPSGIFTSIGFPSNLAYALGISGVYDLLNFQFQMNPASGTVNAGDEITITSDLDDPDHLELDHVSITLNDTPVDAISQTEDELIFKVPIGYSGEFEVFAVGDGTQFSGSVPLGTLSYLYADASGIYRIVLNKTSDTVYEDSGSGDPTTIDIKIPNPFLKTGYIGD